MGTAILILIILGVGSSLAWLILHESREIQLRCESARQENLAIRQAINEVREVLTEASRLKSMKEKEHHEPTGDTIPSKRPFISLAARRALAVKELEEQRGQTERRVAANTRVMEG